MAYDYNSQDNRFDFPNPYRVENFFYFCGSVILILGGIVLLITARSAMGNNTSVAALPLLIGIAMLIHGMVMSGKAMTRLRFYFGRGQPASLAQNLTPDQNGTTKDAAVLTDLMRHSSLAYPEPKGPINGLLYSLFPNLIFSPAYVQTVAQRQFQNALAFSVTLLSLLISLLGTSHDSASWLGLFYFVMALFILIKPVEKGAQGEANIGIKGIIGLVIVAILGPVIVPMITKGMAPPSWLPGAGQAALVMVCGIVGIVLFFRAVMSQSQSGTPTVNMAVVQDTLTMNSHPNQIMDELERKMQDSWVASLPNRVYTRIIPKVLLNQESGIFEGEAVQETQPVPRGEIADMTWKSCFSEPRYRWLGWLNSFGVVTLFFAVVLLSLFGAKFFNGTVIDTGYSAAATLGISFWMLGNFCFRAGGVLWGRFDFVSQLIWVEMKGNYQASKMDYGNQFTDRIKTEKKVINIETMTLRVWVAEIESVAFGKDSRRSILAMRGLKDKAEGLHRVLKDFGTQQSMIVAPTSSVDMQRAHALASMNNIQGQTPPMQALPGAIATAIQNASNTGSAATPAPAAMPVTLYKCPSCEPAHAEGAKFCPDCGSRLAASLV